MAKELRILLAVDDPGASDDRDLVTMLALGLTARGAQASVMQGHGPSVTDRALSRAGVNVTVTGAEGTLSRAGAAWRAIREFRPQVVVSLQSAANGPVAMASLPRRDFVFLASERNPDAAEGRFRRAVRTSLYRSADGIVCNFASDAKRLRKNARRSRDRIHVIPDAVNLDRYVPAEGASASGAELRIVVMEPVGPEQNPFGLLEAVELALREDPRLGVVVDWYTASSAGAGARRRDQPYYRSLSQAIGAKLLTERFRLHPAPPAPLPIIQGADVVCVPSFGEGASLTIPRAMACGVPVLASFGADARGLVRDSRGGVRFDPLSARDMADAVKRLASMSPQERKAMGREGREMAETSLSAEAMVEAYWRLIEPLAG